jgi:hypothetical protein
MALHKVTLPKSAAHLFGIVVLLKRLWKALANPALDANAVNTAWVQNVWGRQDAEWVRKFCLDGQEACIRAIAQAPAAARQVLYEEFCRQNKVEALLNVGGNFQDLDRLPGISPQLAGEVSSLFKQCYKLLSTNAKRKWNGYESKGNRSLSNRAYKDDFCCEYPTKSVCPYCDGEIGTPELDHYLCKSSFPLLACSPWNLIPVCKSCNDMVTAKGDRLALTPGPPNSTDDWLHPFFRPASAQVQIRLTGTPQNLIPVLYSPDPVEQTRLDNHAGLIRSLGERWTRKAAARFDILVREVNRKVNAANTVTSLVESVLEDYEESRGMAASSMVHAAVCRAVLDHRPGYIEEFATPNSPALD